MKNETTDVLVVGGGLAGTAAALFLAWHGVNVTVLEKHPGSSPHPRAIGYTARTLELLRAVGLAEKVPQVPPDLRLRRIRVESLTGPWFEESAWTDAAPELMPSPCTGAAIAQDRMEPILRERAIELGADIRMGVAVTSVAQDADGVTVTAGDSQIRARYLIAADGHRSPIREQLGIGRSGRGPMRAMRSVLFQAPLERYLDRGIHQFQTPHGFLTTYNDGRWVLFLDDRERSEAELRVAIETAVGTPVPITILTTGRWELSALIADRFREGRIFLAGDAAHTLPPSRGGFGANTGIEDAHNLAWKLAAVIRGAGEGLLDSYDAERRPIAWLRHDQIFARQDYKAESAGHGAQTIYPDSALELGQLYRSNAVIGAGDDLPPAATPAAWCGQPGTRFPHAWIAPGLSTLDLLQRGWVVISDDDRWGPQTVRLDLHEQLGLHKGGAVLVRPDGYIAWRSIEMVDAPQVAIANALATMLR
ncbi:MAG: FAD-dependent oxidoreductase [Kofleriaceae bacterium]